MQNKLISNSLMYCDNAIFTHITSLHQIWFIQVFIINQKNVCFFTEKSYQNFQLQINYAMFKNMECMKES